MPGWIAGARRAAWVTLLLMAGGCGGGDGLDRLAVSGRVTLDGKPLSRGEIQFVPKNGDSRGAASGPIVAGEYNLRAADGPAPGDCLVSILPDAATEASADATGTATEAPGEPPADATGPAATVTYAPTSPLEATVAPGQPNRFDFGLTTQRPRGARRP